MSKVDCFQTLKYKGHYVHLKHVDNVEVATVQIFDARKGYGNFFTKEYKSFHASKIFITKWNKGELK